MNLTRRILDIINKNDYKLSAYHIYAEVSEEAF